MLGTKSYDNEKTGITVYNHYSKFQEIQHGKSVNA